MSVKTFAAPEVRKLIDEHFIFMEINVDHEQAISAWFQGEAIPDTRILSADGKSMDRVVGFEEPAVFAARLRKAVEARR
jgi:thioredoxin-like negative regulator of GroEL